MQLKTPNDYERELYNIMEDYKNVLYGTNNIQPPTTWVCNLDKPIRMRTDNSETFVCKLEDKGDYYTHLFPRYGRLNKTYTGGWNWVIDNDSILYFERPFKNRVIKLLKKLLPNSTIESIKNDIIIDGCKIGPTFASGKIEDFTSENNPPTSSIVYLLRWSNVEGLDKYFAGDPNHEKRKASDTPLASLDLFLDMSKEEFIKLLEEQ